MIARLWQWLRGKSRPEVRVFIVSPPATCACGNNAKRGTNPPTCGRCRRLAKDFAEGRTLTSVQGTLAG